MEHLTKEGYLDKDGGIAQNLMMDGLFLENEAVTLASTCSIVDRIAFGLNTHRKCLSSQLTVFAELARERT